MAFVDNKVTRAQLEGVDDVAATARHLHLGSGDSCRPAGEVGFGEYEEACCGRVEAVCSNAGDDLDNAFWGACVEHIGDPRRHIRLLALLGKALRGTGTGGGDDNAPSFGEALTGGGEGRAGAADKGLVVDQPGVTGLRRSKGPDGRPTQASVGRNLAKFVHLEEAAMSKGALRRGLRHAVEIERSVGTRGGAHPCGCEELLGRAVQVLRPSREALRLERNDERSAWKHARQRHEPIDERGHEAFHPLHGLPRRDAREHVARIGKSVLE